MEFDSSSPLLSIYRKQSASKSNYVDTQLVKVFLSFDISIFIVLALKVPLSDFYTSELE